MNRFSIYSNVHNRLISTSTRLLKQPAHYRQRIHRQNIYPFHRTRFSNEEPIDRLPTPSQQVESSFGSKSGLLKFKRSDVAGRLQSLPSTHDKFNELRYTEANADCYHTMSTPLPQHEMLAFVQQLTRSRLLAMALPLPSLSVGTIPHRLGQALHNRLMMDGGPASSPISALMECVYQAAAPHHHRHMQIDERASIESWVKCRQSPGHLFQANDQNHYVDDTVCDSSSLAAAAYLRYRLRGRLDWQLRSTYPLSQFISPDHPDCLIDDLPECTYRPDDFGLESAQCSQFFNVPYHRVAKATEFVRSKAGYWTRTPWFEGDPCEFVLLGALECRRADLDLSLSDSQRLLIDTRRGLADAILTAFASTSAQAYNQGFTLYNDLTYPFCSQQLVFHDNGDLQLVRFQLNSLTSLSTDEETNLPFNMVWSSPRIRLLVEQQEESSDPAPRMHPTSSSEKLVVNSDACQLIDMALNASLDYKTTSSDLQPFLTGDAPRDSIVSSHASPRRLIPFSPSNSSSSLDNDDSVDDATNRVVLSEAERAALAKSMQGASTTLPFRLFAPRKAHPNDAFYLKMTNRRDLVDEIRQLTRLGSQLGANHLPSRAQARLAAYRLTVMRNRRPLRLKESLPRRWQ